MKCEMCKAQEEIRAMNSYARLSDQLAIGIRELKLSAEMAEAAKKHAEASNDLAGYEYWKGQRHGLEDCIRQLTPLL